MELTSEIRERLKKLMQERGETGYSLNQKLGISATTISNYLNGKITKADNTKIRAICESLKSDIYWLETGEEFIADAANINKEIDTSETLLRQLLLKLQCKDDQYVNLHQNLWQIRNDLNSIKKELAHLKDELAQHKQKTDK